MRRAILFSVAALLASCASEPVHPPEIAATDTYTPTPVASTTAAAEVQGGQAQQFVAGKDIPAQWWTLFHSPALAVRVTGAVVYCSGAGSSGTRSGSVLQAASIATTDGTRRRRTASPGSGDRTSGRRS